MSKSIAELMASPSVGLDAQSEEVCLSQLLVLECEKLESEKQAIKLAAVRTSSDPDEAARIRKGAEGPDPRLAEINARLEELNDEMREHMGRFGLKREEIGAWLRWCAANPAREDGRDDRGRPVILAYDDEVGYGYCNALALVDRLGDFVVSWNDEPLAGGQWEWFRARTAPGDLKALAKRVVQIHEAIGGRPSPKPSSGSSTTQQNETA